MKKAVFHFQKATSHCFDTVKKQRGAEVYFTLIAARQKVHEGEGTLRRRLKE